MNFICVGQNQNFAVYHPTLFLLFLLPQDFQLEAQAVYTRAGQRLVRQRQYGAVRQLLKCVGESGTATKNDCDALILSCVSIADKGPADVSDRSLLRIVK